MPAAASAASALPSAASAGPISRTAHDGAAWFPTAESMTIFNGHGAASPASVSTSMAATMMASHARYGRARSRISLVMPADPQRRGAGDRVARRPEPARWARARMRAARRPLVVDRIRVGVGEGTDRLVSSRESAYAQQPCGHERQRRSGETEQHAHAGFRTQLARRQQRGAEEQPDAETDRGDEADDDQFAPAETHAAGADPRRVRRRRRQDTERLAEEDRDRESPRSRLERVDSGTPALTSPKKNSAIWAGYLHQTSNRLSVSFASGLASTKNPGIARRVRQKRHDRHQRERRLADRSSRRRTTTCCRQASKYGQKLFDARPPQREGQAERDGQDRPPRVT